MALVSNPYNTLPSLRVAHDAFHSVADNPKDESGDLYRSLAGLLHKYGLTDDIGIGLLHRHFTLTDDEIVVEFNNISIPVEANRVKFIEAVTKGRIMADGWRISKDGECLEPYEYVFVEKTTEYRDLDFSSSNLRGFTTAFIAKSHHFGVESVICLRRSPPRGSEQALEITEGRANICFTPDQLPPGAMDTGLQTAWYFDNMQQSNKIYRRACFDIINSDPPRHDQVDTTDPNCQPNPSRANNPLPDPLTPDLAATDPTPPTTTTNAQQQDAHPDIPSLFNSLKQRGCRKCWEYHAALSAPDQNGQRKPKKPKHEIT